MWQRFTLSAREAVLGAQNLSVGSRSSSVGITHLFVATLQKIEADSHLAALLLRADLKAEEAVLYAQAALEPDAAFDPNAEPKLSAGAKRVLEFAADEARRAGDNYIGTEHLVLACLRLDLRDETLLHAIAPLGWDLPVLRAHRRELKSLAAQRPTGHPLESLTGEAERAVEAAYAAMRATFCGRISTAHLLLGLLQSDNRAGELLVEVGASPDELKAQSRAVIRSDAVLATPDKRFDKGAKRALDRAKREAQSRGYKFIGADHLLLGLLPRRPTLRERLTWGRTVPDEAAHVLAGVDGEKLRELAGQKRQETAPRRDSQAQGAKQWDTGQVTSASTFIVMCVLGMVLTVPLTRSRVPPRLEDTISLLLFLGLLVGSGLGACWMMLASRKPHLKSAWASAFFGFLLGVMINVLFSR